MNERNAEILDKGLVIAQAWVTDVNRAHGWYEDERSFGDEIALLHSEVSEIFEAYRDYGVADATETEDDHDWDPTCADCEPLGVGSEVADVFIRLLDFCERQEIDLHGEFMRKMLVNENREYRHGGKKL